MKPTLADPNFEPTGEDLQTMVRSLGETVRPGVPDLDKRLQAAVREALREAGLDE